MSAPEFLYGTPGAEILSDDPYAVLDDEAGLGLEDGAECVVEKWTVRPADSHLPDADRLLDWVEEWTADNGEGDEYLSYSLNNVMGRPDVQEAAKALLGLIASNLGWRMADELVSSTTYVLQGDKWTEKAVAA